MTEELVRDRNEIRKAGGSDGEVVSVGEGVLSQPTFVAVVERRR